MVIADQVMVQVVQEDVTDSVECVRQWEEAIARQCSKEKSDKYFGAYSFYGKKRVRQNPNI